MNRQKSVLDKLIEQYHIALSSKEMPGEIVCKIISFNDNELAFLLMITIHRKSLRIRTLNLIIAYGDAAITNLLCNISRRLHELRLYILVICNRP